MNSVIFRIVVALVVGAGGIAISVVAAPAIVTEYSKPKARLLNSEENARFGTAKKNAEAKIGALLIAHHIKGDVSFYVKDRPLCMISEKAQEGVLFEIGTRILNEKGARWYAHRPIEGHSLPNWRCCFVDWLRRYAFYRLCLWWHLDLSTSICRRHRRHRQGLGSFPPRSIPGNVLSPVRGIPISRVVVRLVFVEAATNRHTQCWRQQFMKRPNKSPEPTPTAVTPRANRMKSKAKNPNLQSTEARVAPAVVVAHL